MHRVLLIDEIVARICQYLVKNDRREAAALARSCRALHIPAIEAMWETSNVVHIVKLLPADAGAWDALTDSETVRLYHLQRPLVPNDFAAVMKYAPLVKHLEKSWLYFSFGTRPENLAVSSETLKAIAEQCPSIVLFPALIALDWPLHSCSSTCAKDCNDWVDMPLFIGPKLWRVVITKLDEDHRPLIGILNKVKADCPLIEELVFENSDQKRTEDVSEHVSSVIGELKSLRILRCGGEHSYSPGMLSYGGISLTSSALSRLGKWSYLHDLSLKFSNTRPVPPMCDTDFVALRTLAIHHDNLAGYVMSASSVKLPYVRSVRITWGSLPENRDIRELFQAIRSQFSPLQLSSLTIDSDLTVLGDVYRQRITLRSTYIKPLLDFHKLEEVLIVACWIAEYDDEILIDMASSWPNLRRLILIPEDADDADFIIRATLRPLQAFAFHCPHLECLKVVFHADGNKIPAVSPNTKRDRLPQNLDYINIGPSTTSGSLSEIAAFLTKIFPALCEIDSDVILSEDWKIINGFLTVHRGVREEGRQEARDEMPAAAAGTD